MVEFEGLAGGSGDPRPDMNAVQEGVVAFGGLGLRLGCWARLGGLHWQTGYFCTSVLWKEASAAYQLVEGLRAVTERTYSAAVGKLVRRTFSTGDAATHGGHGSNPQVQVVLEPGPMKADPANEGHYEMALGWKKGSEKHNRIDRRLALRWEDGGHNLRADLILTSFRDLAPYFPAPACSTCPQVAPPTPARKIWGTLLAM